MSALRCYLDYNATAPLRPAALEACVATMSSVGNASSIHAEGRQARSVVELARRRIASLIGAEAERVVFTSGGTEAACSVLTPDLKHDRAPQGPSRLLVAATEHAAVLRGHRFAPDRVTVVPVVPDGRVDLAALDSILVADRTPAVLALQFANNETGVIQPVHAAAERVHAAGGLVVCDAVQAIGRVPFKLSDHGVDVALISGHKLGGPQGTGAFVLGPGTTLGSALLRGGGQERGLRSGTENVAAIAGFGAAGAAVDAAEATSSLVLRDRFERELLGLFPDVAIFGRDTERLCNTSCFAMPGLAAETVLIALDLAGIAVSSGSACSSGKVSRSHVLESMGVAPHLIGKAVRISLGWASVEGEIARLLEAFASLVSRLRKRSLQMAA